MTTSKRKYYFRFLKINVEHWAAHSQLARALNFAFSWINWKLNSISIVSSARPSRWLTVTELHILRIMEKTLAAFEVWRLPSMHRKKKTANKRIDCAVESESAQLMCEVSLGKNKNMVSLGEGDEAKRSRKKTNEKSNVWRRSRLWQLSSHESRKKKLSHKIQLTMTTAAAAVNHSHRLCLWLRNYVAVSLAWTSLRSVCVEHWHDIVVTRRTTTLHNNKWWHAWCQLHIVFAFLWRCRSQWF